MSAFRCEECFPAAIIQRVMTPQQHEQNVIDVSEHTLPPARKEAPSRGSAKLHSARRGQLAEAALAVLCDHGTDKLTADLVAERAGLSRRTFFNYFASTSDALRLGADEIFQWFRDNLENCPPETSLHDQALGMCNEPEEHADGLRRLALLRNASFTDMIARRAVGDSAFEWKMWLAMYLARQLELPVSDLRVTTLTVAWNGAVEAALATWCAETRGDVTPESLASFQQLHRQALRTLAPQLFED